MNFTLKTLVAAVVLVASASANAAINNVQSATGADLFLGVYDFANKNSAIFDLGASFNALATGTLQTTTSPVVYNLSTDSSWLSFVSAEAGNLSAVKWGVFSGQKVSSGVQTLIETISPSATPVAGSAYKSNAVVSALNSLTAFLNTAASNGLSTGGSIFSTGTTAPSLLAVTAFGATGKLNAAGNVVTSALDTAASIVSYTSTANTPVTSTVYNQSPAGITFTLSSAGVLTYAVPEADTYAMLLAGLVVVGAIARRRQA
jgi:hypothetical protein